MRKRKRQRQRERGRERERVDTSILNSRIIPVAWLKCRNLVRLIEMASNWCIPCDLRVCMLTVHGKSGAAAAVRPFAVPGRSWRWRSSPQSVLAISCPLTYLVLFRCNCKVRCLQFNSIYLWFSLCQVEGRPHYLILLPSVLRPSSPPLHTQLILLVATYFRTPLINFVCIKELHREKWT